MSKTLVAYFSATGTTKKAAELVAKAVGADLFEIKPKVPYTAKDLDWMDKKSRSTLEMQDKSSRPEIATNVKSLEAYDKVVIGFPVWWYTAPTIVNTFFESANFEGKIIVPFCTSGGSGVEGSARDLEKTYPKLVFGKGKRFRGGESQKEILEWLK